MTLPDSRPEVNPYASPLPDDSRPSIVAPHELRRELQTLQRLVVWLGVLWIILGAGIIALALIIASVLYIAPDAELLSALAITGAIGALGIVWVWIGIGTFNKSITAIYVGLVLTYLHLAATVFSLIACFGLILLALILHAHRVLRRAAILQRKGVPLTTRPQDIETQLQLPPPPG